MKNKDVERGLSYLKIGRATCLKFIEGLSYQKLVTIPKGFNNSIYWNIAHLSVTQQLLHYKLSGIPMYVSEEFINDFAKGSKAKADYSEVSWKTVLNLFSSLPDKLKVDYENKIFTNYNEYQTSFGIALNSIEDAIAFNNIHEGLHIGYIMALKRAFL